MTGLCGWIGTPNPAETPQCLTDMAAHLGGPDAQLRKSAGGPGGGLAAEGWPRGLVFEEHDGGFVALVGRPWWASGRLAERIGGGSGDAPGAALLEDWRARGREVLQDLHGAVSVALVDPARDAALVATDRVGIHPMAFASHAAGIVFGSSATAVRAHPAIGSDIRTQGLYDYLFFYISPGPGTVWQGIDKLLPGECLEVVDGSASVHTYWKMTYTADPTLTPDAAAEALRVHLRDAVFRAVEPEDKATAGAFLSGGLDSSTVCGLLAERVGDGAKSFTIGFDADGYDETPYAKIAAKAFALDYGEVYLTPADTLATIPRIAAAFDEPFGNSSAIPALLCGGVARDSGVAMLLAGDGGDELFAGNERYVSQLAMGTSPQLPGPAASLARSVGRMLSGPARSGGLAAKIRNRLVSRGSALPERLDCYNPLFDGPPPGLFAADFLAKVDTDHPVRLQRQAYAVASSDGPLAGMMGLDLRLTLADNDLRKVSRTADLAGVEVLFPMLDEDLVRFSGTLSPDTLLPGNALRGFYKNAMRGFLPDAILDKPKHGFGMPFGLWLREDPALNDFACAALTDFTGRGILDKDFLDGLIDRHRRQEDHPFAGMVWDVTILQHWMSAHRV